MRKTEQPCHIYNMLAKAPQHVSFHTPGHKQGKWDITELSFSDNLSNPTGVLFKAEEDVTRILGAAKSFLLTDGSTCGVLSMLYASGVKKLLLPASAHKSVWNGCKLLHIEPVPVRRMRKDGIPDQITVRDIEENALFADGVLLTSPDYYGILPDLPAVREACSRLRMTLLIDGAHGGHLKGTPAYAGHYADLWVDGVHKSLPALTQGAVVSANARFAEKLKEGVDIFRTTSPSYPILASVEYAVKAPASPAIERLSEGLRAEFGLPNDDWTKLVVDFGDCAYVAEEYFEEKGIYPEFNDGRYLMFYFSSATTEKELVLLRKHLQKLGAPVSAALPAAECVAGNRVGMPEWIPLAESEGRTAARAAGLFPPCIPLLQPGDLITKSVLQKLTAAKNTFGLDGTRICVYNEREVYHI